MRAGKADRVRDAVEVLDAVEVNENATTFFALLNGDFGSEVLSELALKFLDVRRFDGGRLWV